MNGFDIVVGILLIAAAIVLVALVLMQEGKSKNLSGAIAGGADTFFGKQKGKKISKTLSWITTGLSIVFVIAVLLLYLAVPYAYKIDYSALKNLDNSATTILETTSSGTTSSTTTASTDTNTTADTTADSNTDTASDTTAETSADTIAETSADTNE